MAEMLSDMAPAALRVLAERGDERAQRVIEETREEIRRTAIERAWRTDEGISYTASMEPEDAYIQDEKLRWFMHDGIKAEGLNIQEAIVEAAGGRLDVQTVTMGDEPEQDGYGYGTLTVDGHTMAFVCGLDDSGEIDSVVPLNFDGMRLQVPERKRFYNSHDDSIDPLIADSDLDPYYDRSAVPTEEAIFNLFDTLRSSVESPLEAGGDGRALPEGAWDHKPFEGGDHEKALLAAYLTGKYKRRVDPSSIPDDSDLRDAMYDKADQDERLNEILKQAEIEYYDYGGPGTAWPLDDLFVDGDSRAETIEDALERARQTAEDAAMTRATAPGARAVAEERWLEPGDLTPSDERLWLIRSFVTSPLAQDPVRSTLDSGVEMAVWNDSDGQPRLASFTGPDGRVLPTSDGRTHVDLRDEKDGFLEKAVWMLGHHGDRMDPDDMLPAVQRSGYPEDEQLKDRGCYWLYPEHYPDDDWERATLHDENGKEVASIAWEYDWSAGIDFCYGEDLDENVPRAGKNLDRLWALAEHAASLPEKDRAAVLQAGVEKVLDREVVTLGRGNVQTLTTLDFGEEEAAPTDDGACALG